MLACSDPLSLASYYRNHNCYYFPSFSCFSLMPESWRQRFRLANQVDHLCHISMLIRFSDHQFILLRSGSAFCTLCRHHSSSHSSRWRHRMLIVTYKATHWVQLIVDPSNREHLHLVPNKWMSQTCAFNSKAPVLLFPSAYSKWLLFRVSVFHFSTLTVVSIIPVRFQSFVGVSLLLLCVMLL